LSETPPLDSTKKKRGDSEWGTAADGFKALRTDYHYWTERLTSVSFQIWLALVAANWAVFGSVDHIINNVSSKFSIFVVTTGVAADVVCAWRMGELHRREIDKANADLSTWERRWKDGWNNPKERWPFTRNIERTGAGFRVAKVFLMALAWALFGFALL